MHTACKSSNMPRKPTSDEAIACARFFLGNFIERTNNADHILPKNDIYSPFFGFCRVFPQVLPFQLCYLTLHQLISCTMRVQFAKKKDGGTSTDGVSRAAFNKICLEFFVSISAVLALCDDHLLTSHLVSGGGNAQTCKEWKSGSIGSEFSSAAATFSAGTLEGLVNRGRRTLFEWRHAFTSTAADSCSYRTSNRVFTVR